MIDRRIRYRTAAGAYHHAIRIRLVSTLSRYNIHRTGRISRSGISLGEYQAIGNSQRAKSAKMTRSKLESKSVETQHPRQFSELTLSPSVPRPSPRPWTTLSLRTASYSRFSYVIKTVRPAITPPHQPQINPAGIDQPRQSHPQPPMSPIDTSQHNTATCASPAQMPGLSWLRARSRSRMHASTSLDASSLYYNVHGRDLRDWTGT